MTDLEYEFEQLKERYKRAQDYFKTKYDTDSPQGKEKAQKAFQELTARMDELWERIGKMSIQLDPWQSEDEWLELIGKQEFWKTVRIDCYRLSQKIVVRFERPAFWRDPDTKVTDE